MEKYQVIKALGGGSFGCVWQAINTETGEVVAIKKLIRKSYSIAECLNMGEVKSLRKLNHPNIIKLKELAKINDYLYFVFEHMESDLFKLMMERKNGFSESEVRNWLFQLFHGLAYMHHCGYFHHDLKPANLLVSKNVIKIADLGSAREVYSKPPYTDYVTTRFYRAPEVLLRSTMYNWAVDMWAMGAIMAELFTLRPLFEGSSATDQMYKICSVMGTPTWSDWPLGLLQANSMNYQFPQLPGVHLSQLIPNACADAIDLIYSLCSWDPLKRPTASQCLQHPFFNSCYFIPRSPSSTVASSRTYPCATREKSYRSVLMASKFQKLELGNETEYQDDVCPVGKISMNSGMTTLNSKPARNYAPAPARSHASLARDLQRRLEMNIVDALRNEYGMPRFYSRIRKVYPSEFQLRITWLEPSPEGSEEVNWFNECLPVASGKFVFGESEETSNRDTFSHQIHFKKDFVEGGGIKVTYLDKVEGFVSVFQRTSREGLVSRSIPSTEILRFSHRIPSFQLSGNEREGVPPGSFELDTASLSSDFYPVVGANGSDPVKME